MVRQIVEELLAFVANQQIMIDNMVTPSGLEHLLKGRIEGSARTQSHGVLAVQQVRGPIHHLLV
ncbi:Uncharacterised protein [Mycobacteroides abscessus subsp. abscessus]|nr:Uncharacterised protein [Mycobacteroides abscessus subsp. abscessus]